MYVALLLGHQKWALTFVEVGPLPCFLPIGSGVRTRRSDYNAGATSKATLTLPLILLSLIPVRGNDISLPLLTPDKAKK